MTHVDVFSLKSEKEVKRSPRRNAWISAASDQSPVATDSSSKNSRRRPLKLMSSNIGSNNGAIRTKASAKADLTSPSDHVSRRASTRNAVLAVMPSDHKRKVNEKMFDQSILRASDQRRTCRDVSDDQASTSHVSATISSTNKNGSRKSCMYCKPSTSESICFIDNSGKIAAAHLVPGSAFVHDHHHHHSPVRCSPISNGNKLVSSSASASQSVLGSRKTSYILKSVACAIDKGKADVRDDICSANSNPEPCQAFFQNLQDEENQHLSTIYNQNSEGCGSISCTTPSAAEAAKTYRTPGGDQSMEMSFNMLSPPWTSSDGENSSSDGLDGGAEVLNHESLCCIGDDKDICSENNTDGSTNPIFLTDSMVEDVSEIYLESSVDVKSFEKERSKVSWMSYKYLHALQEQESEKIRLRKQEIEARKQAREWMLDYHMEEELQRLAPNGIARVKTLVEAYEAIMQHYDFDGYHSLSPDHALHQ